MAQFILIVIGAGAAAALLFASPASGVPLALVLAQLAPLPILIAGLGWSHWSALLATLASALGLAAYFGWFVFFVFLLSVGLPAWWLCYLALLARPDASGSGVAEWYPASRLALWASMLGALVTAVWVVKVGSTDAGLDATLRSGFERVLRLLSGTPEGAPLALPGVADPVRFIALLVVVIPPGAAMIASITSLFNLWLAGHVVKMSGRLSRPWPDLAELRFPPVVAAVLVAALAGSLLTDMPGVLCRLVAASLLVAYVLVGFAVLHALTRHLQSRFFVLTSAYAAVLVFQWPTVIVLLIGLADTLLDLRTRAATRRGPPRLPSS